MTKKRGLAAIGLAIFGAAVREMYEIKFAAYPFATQAAANLIPTQTWVGWWPPNPNTAAGNY